MPADEFRGLTPADLDRLIEAWEARERREDYRAGVVACLIANSNRDRKETPRPFRVSDFFPRLAEPRPEPTDEELEARLDMLASSTGAKDTTKG